MDKKEQLLTGNNNVIKNHLRYFSVKEFFEKNFKNKKKEETGLKLGILLGEIINFSKKNENEKDYIISFKIFNNDINKCFGTKIQTSELVIERESNYNKNISGVNGKGYMQLTTAPFDDLKIGKIKNNSFGRGEIYIKYFQKIQENNLISKIPNENIKKNFLELFEISKNNPIDKKSWNEKILILEKEKLNPYVNLIIGNMLLANLGEQAKETKDSIINSEIKLLDKINIKKFDVLLKNKGIYLSDPSKAIIDLKIKLGEKNPDGNYKNQELREQFFTLAKYNANHKDNTKTYYTATIITHQLFKENKIV